MLPPRRRSVRRPRFNMSIPSILRAVGRAARACDSKIALLGILAIVLLGLQSSVGHTLLRASGVSRPNSTFVELYFTRPQALPSSVPASGRVEVSFVVGNVAAGTRTFAWQVSQTKGGGHLRLASGQASVGANQTLAIARNLTRPLLDGPRTAARLDTASTSATHTMAHLSQPSVSYQAPHARWRRLVAGRDIVRAIWVVELLVLDVAVAGNTLWLERVAAALLLAVLPGRLLLRALRVPASSVYQYVAYLPCRVGGGSRGQHLAGRSCRAASRPARALASPAAVGRAESRSAGLAALGHRAPDSCNLSMPDLIGRVRWLWPLLLPVVSVTAAARLDNGDGNLLAVVVVVACAVMIPICTVKADSMHRRQTKLLLYSSGLSLMLLTSMRSSYVIGFDINSEYFDFHQTVLNGVWHFGHLNPYEAMLSLTVLPASLHTLIGGQDVWIFKLGYPALFALFPVAVFELGTRFLSGGRRSSRAALVVSQAYFFQQQPEIARQELALLIFAGIVGVLFDTSLGRDVQVILVSVLGLTLVVCHYSTTYITIGLCLMASVVAKLLSFRRPTKIPSRAG